MRTITERHLRKEYKRLDPDGHWFDKGTMRFFDSRIECAYQSTTNLFYFVSSEQSHGSKGSGPRKFSVRQLDSDGVDTVGQFQQFDTLDQAENAAIRLARNAKKAGAP